MPVIYPIYSLNYRRPDSVPSSPRERSGSQDGSIRSDVSNDATDAHILKAMPSNPRGVPEALSFDRIINGGCCPPLTNREFLNYLKYHEKSAENLQFYLWFQDYVTRFAQLPESERNLAPEWTEAQAEAERKDYRQSMRKRGHQKVPSQQEMFKGTDFEQKTQAQESIDSTSSANITPFSEEKKSEDWKEGRPSTAFTGGVQSFMTNYSHKADSAFEENGLKRPFTVQPYREEISRILTTYVIMHAPRELNLSGRERRAVLKALEYTTHPSAFREIINNVEYTLRHQAHPNFVRHAISNGNKPRVLFARGLGAFLILAGIITEILITLSSVGRGWRVLPIVLLIIGFSTLFAAMKGMCVVLHGLHHEHVRPWELFLEDDESLDKASRDSSDYNPKASVSLESFSSTSSNSFEDEPWIEKYGKRNLIRKIFDREVWIKEPALRQIQDTIFVQSLLASILASAIVVGIFVAVPKGHKL